MIYIDKCAYTNKLTNIHPLEKIIFVLATITACLSAKSIFIPIIAMAVMGYLSVFKAGISLKFYIKLMMLPLGFLFLGVISIAVNIIQNPDNALWSVNIFNISFGVTSQSLNVAARLLLKSLGSVSCLYFLSLTTPLIDIISVLRKLKLPNIFLELVGLIYRFIFILIGIAGQICTAQSSRLGHSTIKNQYRSMGYLISSLFIISYKKANDLFTALEARCYTDTIKVLEKQYKFSKINMFFIILFEAALLFLEVKTGRII